MKKCKYIYASTNQDDVDIIFPECKLIKEESTSTSKSLKLSTNNHYGKPDDPHWWTYCPYCGKKIRSVL